MLSLHLFDCWKWCDFCPLYKIQNACRLFVEPADTYISFCIFGNPALWFPKKLEFSYTMQIKMEILRVNRGWFLRSPSLQSHLYSSAVHFSSSPILYIKEVMWICIKCKTNIKQWSTHQPLCSTNIPQYMTHYPVKYTSTQWSTHLPSEVHIYPVKNNSTCMQYTFSSGQYKSTQV